MLSITDTHRHLVGEVWRGEERRGGDRAFFRRGGEEGRESINITMELNVETHRADLIMRIDNNMRILIIY